MSRIARVRRRHSVAIMPPSRQANTSFARQISRQISPGQPRRSARNRYNLPVFHNSRNMAGSVIPGKLRSGGIRSLAAHALICNGKEYSTFLEPALRG
jgi:hypothetical protein